MPGNRILCIGECMVEFAPAQEDFYRRSFAGDTFNTAWYLRKSLPPNVEVLFATVIGNDPISDQFLEFAKSAGINTEAVRQDPNRTMGLYTIQTNDGERSFSYWRGQSAARQLGRDVSWLGQIIGSVGAIYFSGITMAIMDIDGRANLLAELTKARSKGSQIVFDPNLRPKLWEGSNEMTQWTTAAANCSDIVLPSFDDEAAHFGDAGPEATANRYLAGQTSLVVVKNADKSVLVATTGQPTLWIDVDPVGKVVDSTAAGDSFNAGFLSAYIADEPLEICAQHGARLAAKVIQGQGALIAT